MWKYGFHWVKTSVFFPWALCGYWNRSENCNIKVFLKAKQATGALEGAILWCVHCILSLLFSLSFFFSQFEVNNKIGTKNSPFLFWHFASLLWLSSVLSTSELLVFHFWSFWIWRKSVISVKTFFVYLQKSEISAEKSSKLWFVLAVDKNLEKIKLQSLECVQLSKNLRTLLASQRKLVEEKIGKFEKVHLIVLSLFYIIWYEEN